MLSKLVGVASKHVVKAGPSYKWAESYFIN